MAEDDITARVTIERQSPWFSGHFPDNPVLPGIAQLKMVADIIAASLQDNDLHMTGLSRIKFRKIVRPGEQLDINANIGKAKNQYSFRITSSNINEEVCSGMMLFAKKDTIERLP